MPADRLLAESLRLDSPDPVFNIAFDTAKTVLASLRAQDHPGDVVWPTLAALAAGMVTPATAWLARSRARTDADTAALPSLEHAAHLDWTGHVALAPDPHAALNPRAPLAEREDLASRAQSPAWRAWAAGSATGAFAALDRDPARLAQAGPMAAAMFVLAVVHGMLGAEPDATRNRLRLRPQIPAEWASLEMTNLRMSDAFVALRYRREHGVHAFEIEQERGAVPVRLVFEPAVEGAATGVVRIDGQPAALDARRHGERTVYPVQLVLDHARRVEVGA